MRRFWLLALLVLPGGAAADWPLFRGNPSQTGVTKENLPEPLTVRWKIKLKDGIESTAAIVAGTVYVGSFDEHLRALDLATGREKWKFKAGAIKTPVSVRHGAVYVGNEDGIFHCVDAKSGQSRWTFDTASEVTSGANFAGDSIIFGSAAETLFCLSAEGKVRWRFHIGGGGPVMGTPAVEGGLTFVAGCDSHLHVVDVKEGKEKTKIDLGGQVGSAVAAAGKMLYVGTMTNQVHAVDLAKNAIAWTFDGSQAFYSSPALTDTQVIVGGRDRLVHAFDRMKGTEIWTFATKGQVDSSPVVVDGRVIVGSKDGNLYVLNRDKGTLLQTLKLGQSIKASPAVADGCVVIGANAIDGAGAGGTTIGILYCLGKKE
jgi:outer membrane protein assembly factor BamB